MLVCLGKRNRPIKFTTDETRSDKEVLKKRIIEEFKDCLTDYHQNCEMITQMKDEEWNQFVKISDERVQDSAVLQAFVEA